MARVALTWLADADAAEILTHLGERAGAGVANHYEAAFDSVYRTLERFPDSGAPRPKLGADVRIAVVSPYLIVYEHLEDDDVVTIMRIVDGRRKITRRLIAGG
jgi:toxin ParE1/3/4